MSDRPRISRALDRRTALGVLGSACGALTIGGCSGGGGSPTPAAAATASTTATPVASAAASVSPTPQATAGVNATATPLATAASSCVATNEGEIGPYFADDSASGFDRSSVRTNVDGTDLQNGVPLTLNLYVVDTGKSCGPYAGAQIDIWHCNASGVYSDIASEDTSSQMWLRGYQLTNAAGYARFETIVPGWYPGRTTHIHVRVRSSYSEASSTSDGTNTTQVFFPQTMNDDLQTNVAPYDARGKNPTTNAADRVYGQETKGQTLLTLTGDNTNGFTSTFTIGLPIGG